MDQLAQIITQPWMVYVFVSIILLVALIALYQAVVSVGKVRGDISKAIAVLHSNLEGGNQQEQFYNSFKTISAQIAKIEGLRHAWREFIYTIHFGNASMTKKKAFLSHRPAYYFNRDSVLGNRLNLSQFFAYPNYLIGIGLTFTFIGLAAALHVAQAGLSSGGGQQALKDLLAVASIKFISSIVGIVSSLVISAIQRIRIQAFQQELSAFCELLEECTEYKSTEKLLHDGLYEQQKQTVLLGTLGPSIATSLNEALGSQLAAGVTNALDPLTQELRTLANGFTRSVEDSMNGMANAFLNQLRQTSASDLNGIMQGAQALRASLEGLATNIETAGRSFGTNTQESTARLASTMDGITTALASVQQGMAQFGQALASLDSAAKSMEHAGDHIGGAAQDNKASAQAFSHSLSQVAGELAPLGPLLSSLSGSLARVEQTAANLQTAGGALAGAAEGFKHSAAAIEKAGVQVFVNVMDERLTHAMGQATEPPILPQAVHDAIGKLKAWWTK